MPVNENLNEFVDHQIDAVWLLYKELQEKGTVTLSKEKHSYELDQLASTLVAVKLLLSINEEMLARQ